jgi:undecaprenyl-diphosphatase
MDDESARGHHRRLRAERMEAGKGYRAALAIAGAAALILLLPAMTDLRAGRMLLEWDRGLFAAAESLRTPSLDIVMRCFTMLGNWQTVAAGTALAVALFLGSGKRRCAAMLFVSVNAGALFTWAAKAFIHRARPPFIHAITGSSGFSFPSGHAFVAFSFYCCLLHCLYTIHRKRWTRNTTIVGGAVIALGIGVSRVYLGVHWPSDVLTGWFAGAVWLAAFMQMTGEKNRSQ